MKINQVAGAIGAYNQHTTRKVTRSGGAARPDKSDEVLLSKEAQEVRHLKEKLAQAPEVRPERIEDLRRQIDAGTYKPAGQDVAAKMLRAKVFDDLL